MEKEKQHQLTDQKIKKAAKLLFSKKNPQNITVEEVCALAGVKRITFYHHFHSKDEFLLRSIQEILETERKNHLFLKFWILPLVISIKTIRCSFI